MEFVSTLEAYRRRGMATAVSNQVLLDLRVAGVREVTLRSSPEAVPLYARLGFEACYEQVIMSYEKKGP